MTTIAVLGANGQVGAELCLMLARRADVRVVPVCRSRRGSSFLRYQGIACRHGEIRNADDARRLIGDCDVIVNLALTDSLADPVAARQVDRALLESVAAGARRGASHIYFSTMSIYGDKRVDQLVAFRNSYGAGKIACERMALAFGARAGQPTFVFRLGHVCGALQNISRQIRSLITSGVVALPDLSRGSNTVYVATIDDAVHQVVRGSVRPGTYDLMNVPQWSWQELFEYEAQTLGITARLVSRPVAKSRPLRKLPTLLNAIALQLARSSVGRRMGSRLIGHLPVRWYERIRAHFAVRSARAQIQQLGERQSEPMDAFMREPIVPHALPTLNPTRVLLDQMAVAAPLTDRRAPWPNDLPDVDAVALQPR
jgi:nucleoside-diphosphate-sugar epimerase